MSVAEAELDVDAAAQKPAGLLEITILGRHSGEVIEHLGLTELVADLFLESEASPIVPERFEYCSRLEANYTEVLKCCGLELDISYLAGERKCSA